jgi:hypothetical protein
MLFIITTTKAGPRGGIPKFKKLNLSLNLNLNLNKI